jgi:signal transduction histidine kinase
MSTSSRLFSESPPRPDVLGELFHSLSQPLTSLRRSLELSLESPRELTIEEAVERPQESVAVALQQIEKVIGMIQLMREYLDAEQPGQHGRPSPLAPAVSSVIDQLSSIAAVRGVRLRLFGTALRRCCFRRRGSG